MSEVRVIEDILPDLADDSRRSELISMFRKLYTGTVDPDLDALFESDLPLGVLTDIVAQALGLPASVKQVFLGEPRVGKRAVDLLDLLRHIGEYPPLSEDESIAFPPPFSVN